MTGGHFCFRPDSKQQSSKRHLCVAARAEDLGAELLAQKQLVAETDVINSH